MKFLLLSTLLVVAVVASPFVGQPAQLILHRNDNRAILQITPEAFGNQYQQRLSGESHQGFIASQGLSHQEEFQQELGGQTFSSSANSFSSSQNINNNPIQEPSGSRFSSQSSNQEIRGFDQGSAFQSQSFSNSQSSQRLADSRQVPKTNFENSQQSPITSQPGFISSQQSSSRILQESANPNQGFIHDAQSSSRFSQRQREREPQQRPFNGNQNEGNSQQLSGSSSKQSSRLLSQGKNFQSSRGPHTRSNNLQESFEQGSSENQEETDGVFEPLNLPSGATRLLGDISSSFSCIEQPYGYYADQQNSCRVFHICYPALFSDGRMETYHYSFMCGEGSRFDQKEMTCVKEEDAIACESSSEFFYKNSEFGLPGEHVDL